MGDIRFCMEVPNDKVQKVQNRKVQKFEKHKKMIKM